MTRQLPAHRILAYHDDNAGKIVSLRIVALGSKVSERFAQVDRFLACLASCDKFGLGGSSFRRTGSGHHSSLGCIPCTIGECQYHQPNQHLPSPTIRWGFRESHESSESFDPKSHEEETERVRLQACDCFLEIAHTDCVQNMPKQDLGVSW